MAKNSFRSINVVPSIEDLVNQKPSQYDFGVWDPVEIYLSIKFHKTRDELLKPANKMIKEYLDKRNANQRSDMRMYSNVKLERFHADDDTYGFKLIFDDTDWQYLKLRILKKLVILSQDNFKTMLLLSVKSCCERKGFLLVEPLLNSIIESERFNCNYVLLETNVCFETYYQTLSILQSITKDSFPMTDYIVKNNCKTKIPSYLSTPGVPRSFIIQRLTNESQFIALKSALAVEFAVITGGCGTGKTFLASEIIRNLFVNKESWRKRGSIVVVCKTDKTLDTILKSVIPYNRSIVRVGQSQTKDESLKPYSLMELREELGDLLDKNSKCAEFYKKKFEVEVLLRNLHKLHAFFSSRVLNSRNVASNDLDSSQKKEDSISEMESLDTDLLIHYDKNDTNIKTCKNGQNPESCRTLEKSWFTVTSSTNILQKLLKNIILSNDPQERENHLRSFKSCADDLSKNISELEKLYQVALNELREIKREADREVISRRKVIGITAASIAEMQSIMRSLAAPIVLVDEAEDIPETLLLCSMSEQCKHVILIGDKNKPTVTDSLFKRISNSGYKCMQLVGQHRMHPQIAKLMSIFSNEALESKADNKNLPGMESNLFFIDCAYDEVEIVDEEMNFFIQLAKYLVQVDHKASDIAILGITREQAQIFSKEVIKHEDLKTIKVSSVSDFSGSESKIVLLLLVHYNNAECLSNSEIERTLYIALSRAREGFFIIGNMKALVKKHEIWSKIKKILVEEQAIGKYLNLSCWIHPEQKFQAKSPDDIKRFSTYIKNCTKNDKKCYNFLHEIQLNFSRVEKPSSRSISTVNNDTVMGKIQDNSSNTSSSTKSEKDLIQSPQFSPISNIPKSSMGSKHPIRPKTILVKIKSHIATTPIGSTPIERPKRLKRKPARLVESSSNQSQYNFYSCAICSQVFTCKYLYDKHKKDEHIKTFVCKVCGKRFLTKRKLNLHHEIHRNLMFECDHCKRIFETKCGISQHLRVCERK